MRSRIGLGGKDLPGVLDSWYVQPLSGVVLVQVVLPYTGMNVSSRWSVRVTQ